eukprot:UN25356
MQVLLRFHSLAVVYCLNLELYQFDQFPNYLVEVPNFVHLGI